MTEDLNVKGMVRNKRLALSLHDASSGEMLRQVAYRCEWAGVARVKADRFYPSTQRCSSCGTMKEGTCATAPVGAAIAASRSAATSARR